MTFDVPDKTTINDSEFTPDRYAIGFAPELVEFILQDRKLTTFRFGSKYDYLTIGDEVKIQNSATGKIAATVQITGKRTTTFKHLPLEIGTHESYKSKEHQRDVLSGYYAFLGRPIADDDSFLVFNFALLG